VRIALKPRLSRDNKKRGRPFALFPGLILLVLLAVSVRLATVDASISWKRVLTCPK